MAHLEIQAVIVALVCWFGAVGSQTTFTPAVTDITNLTSTTLSESDTTITPIMLSTTTPGCSSLNISSCQTCEPGTYYNNEAVVPVHQAPISHKQDSRHVFPAHQASTLISQEAPCVRHVLLVLTQMKVVQSHVKPVHQVFTHPDKAPLFVTHVLRAHTASMYKTSHEKMCEICRNGFYQIHWGQENCDICPEEHYCPSPDVNPIQCPSDAFCPEGSTAPGYCMETFFRKAGDTCELSPLTIALIAIGGALFLLFISLLVFRKRDADGELSLHRAPLLRKDRPRGHVYGVLCDADPVYAGW
ncbi:hypothetical protein Baya_8885 [Bagarius yarrelli]|uniref:Tyrosine-protein kinase ephrin type A/B receptor-like domain-containing protein n=1 Tax=Bagarius yarrelli TaxID=175774 RepID=A0A556U7I8_BAGYA|nr:hypothetical protein Baya_8885 [Bagarius yarrelli]